MTDETPSERTDPRPVDGAPPPPAFGDATPDATDDPDAALERLASMGAGTAAEPLPPSPAVSGYSGPSPGRPARQMGSSQRTPRARPRPAGGPGSTRHVARIAAPIIFLIAVMAFVGIVVQSGVMGGSEEPTPTPTAKATKSATATRKYVVKSGDSMSSLAERFDTSVATLQQLNPDLSTTTLVVGTTILVPKQ